MKSSGSDLPNPNRFDGQLSHSIVRVLRGVWCSVNKQRAHVLLVTPNDVSHWVDGKVRYISFCKSWPCRIGLKRRVSMYIMPQTRFLNVYARRFRSSHQLLIAGHVHKNAQYSLINERYAFHESRSNSFSRSQDVQLIK
jgi:hypothetical protein